MPLMSHPWDWAAGLLSLAGDPDDLPRSLAPPGGEKNGGLSNRQMSVVFERPPAGTIKAQDP